MDPNLYVRNLEQSFQIHAGFQEFQHISNVNMNNI